MSRARQPKHGYGRAPAKGSKLRQALLMMLRPQGATVHELIEAGLVSDPRRMGHLWIQLRDYKGYDIRPFPLTDRTEQRCGPILNKGRPGRQPVAYRCLGRWTWNRRYRPFIRLDRLV